MDLSRPRVRFPFFAGLFWVDHSQCYSLRLEIENDRLRHIRLHERVNDLPDPNYATLKFLMGHLDKYVASLWSLLPLSLLKPVNIISELESSSISIRCPAPISPSSLDPIY
jgi:hypothetical protein